MKGRHQLDSFPFSFFPLSSSRPLADLRSSFQPKGPAAQDVGGHQGAEVAAPELLQGRLALLLAAHAVDGAGPLPELLEDQGGQLVRGVAGAHKNQGLATCAQKQVRH